MFNQHGHLVNLQPYPSQKSIIKYKETQDITEETEDLKCQNIHLMDCLNTLGRWIWEVPPQYLYTKS